MAFTVTNRGSNSATYTTSQVISGAAFTPTEGDLLIAMLRLNSSSPTAISSITGHANTTWSQIQTSGNVFLWAAIVGASPGSAQVTANFGSSQSVQGVVTQVAGADTSGSTAAVFVQNQTLSSYNPSSPLSFTALSAFASSTNMAMNFGGVDQGSFSFQAESGFTKAVDSIVDDASPLWSVACFYKSSEDTTMALVDGTTPFFGYRTIEGIAFEIAEETGGGGGSVEAPPTGSFALLGVGL